MKKLLIVTEALEMNGVLRSLLDFMKAIDKSQYEISLFCFDAFCPDFAKLPDYVKVLPEIPGCYMARAPLARIVRWAVRHGAYYSLVRRLVVSLLQKKFPSFRKADLAINVPQLAGEYDVACAYSMGMTWSFVADKVTATQKLLWLHTDPLTSNWSCSWEKYRPCVGSCSALVCVSNGVRDKLRAKCPAIAGKIFAVHNVVDAKRIIEQARAPLPYPKTSRVRLVTIGRFSTEKNQHLIPDIAARLKQEGRDFEWFLVGPSAMQARRGKLPELQRLGVVDVVRYEEALSNPYPLVASADICVQLSTFEGWGLSLTEALVLGRYCVATDIPSFREQLTDSRFGSLVKLDVDQIAKAISGAIAARSWERCSGFNVNQWTFDRTASEFKKVVESCK